MKKIITFLISSILVVSAFGCQGENYQTSAQKSSEITESSQAPEETDNSKNENNSENVPQIDESAEDNEAPKDSNNDDDDENNNTDDRESTNDIEAKLKTALPKSDLEVEEKDDNILIKGTVASESDMKTVEKIVSQIKTTKSVKVETSVGSQNKY